MTWIMKLNSEKRNRAVKSWVDNQDKKKNEGNKNKLRTLEPLKKRLRDEQRRVHQWIRWCKDETHYRDKKGLDVGVRAWSWRENIETCRYLLRGHSPPVSVNAVFKVQHGQPPDVHIQHVVIEDVLKGKIYILHKFKQAIKRWFKDWPSLMMCKS